MKRFKKLITIGLTCAMVLGSSMATNAMSSGNSSAACLRCGKKGYLTYQSPGLFCNRVTYCHAPVSWFYCTACLSAYDACSAWHLQ